MSVTIRYIDASITFLFLLEALVKIMTIGFFWTSLKGDVVPYIKSGWNILDILVVTTSLLDFFITQTTESRLT